MGKGKHMYKIKYLNPDGTGFSETEPWVSEPITKEQLDGALEKMNANGCTVINVTDVGENFPFTQTEMQMLYAACMSYGDKLSHIIVKHIPHEDAGIVKSLSERATEFWNLAAKITGYMESDCT